MSLQFTQNLKLIQQLVMTPQLQQAIKLLQLSRLELTESIQQSLLENPLLEEKQAQTRGEDQEAQKKPSDGIQRIDVQEKHLLKSAEWDDYLGVFSSTSRHAKERDLPELTGTLENMYSRKPSLESHLHWQLSLSNLDSRQKKIGEVIIGNLGSNGYLQSTPEEIRTETGASSEEVERVLEIIHFFDPVGVAARSLEECLTVQARFQELEDPLLYSLIQNHLSDIEEGRVKELMKSFDVEPGRIEACIDTIRSFDPRPGMGYSEDDVVYISPDAYIFKVDEDFTILLNDEGLPDLQINASYLEKDQDPEAAEYLKKKLQEAEWLVKSLQQRQKTLYRVLEYIVDYQREFFLKGPAFLKPMVLKDVSGTVGVHESTVSRITTSKYVSTPFGILDLKFFFGSGLETANGSHISSESIKLTLKGLITEVDRGRPLSDEKISKHLKEMLDVSIARRTVAKYRDILQIPSSKKRKKK
ncbi:MAG: RNA polymerase factor sigma-54 [Desulfohalobiaceae bacterium]|nr:RNA polymerase factor sigma-54 [Desulfohalobiaceae bacterium]